VAEMTTSGGDKMNGKTKTSVRLAAVTGVAMLSMGSFSYLSTANADTNGLSPVGIGLSQGQLFAGAVGIGNTAPGDKPESDTLVVTNTGTQAEWLQINNTLTGPLFADNGMTGSSLGSLTVNGITDYVSKDYAATGDSPAFAFDNHPMQIGYTIQLSGIMGNNQPITVAPFSSTQSSPALYLYPQQQATVTYTYYPLTLAAHNDYQGATGELSVELNASANIDSNPPPNHPSPPPTGGNPPPTGGTPPPTGNPPPPTGTPPGGSTPPTGTPPAAGGSPPASGSKGVVLGGTTPVTGLPVRVIVFEGVTLFVVGGSLLLAARRKNKKL